MHLPFPSHGPIDGTRARVLLTHACPIVRAGLAAILSAQPDLIVDSSASCPEAFSEPCILITDYTAGLAAARHPWPTQPGCAPRVLILTGHHKEGEVRRAVDSGVHGYLLMGSSPEELVKSVRYLCAGMNYLSASATRSVIDSMQRDVLTRRETEVLEMLVRGGSDKLIARELGIGVGTVKTHLKHLMAKLGVTARTHAVVEALRRGLLSELPVEIVVQGGLQPAGSDAELRHR
jgi:DNA-binding NarL/FixJ family response regulator